MTIELLKTFSNTGFKLRLEQDEVSAEDNHGNKL